MFNKLCWLIEKKISVFHFRWISFLMIWKSYQAFHSMSSTTWVLMTNKIAWKLTMLISWCFFQLYSYLPFYLRQIENQIPIQIVGESINSVNFFYRYRSYRTSIKDHVFKILSNQIFLIFWLISILHTDYNTEFHQKSRFYNR